MIEQLEKPSWYLEARREVAEVFARSHPVDSETHDSPSGQYQLEVTSYSTGPNTWSYSRGRVIAKSAGRVIAQVDRNFDMFPFSWCEAHANGHSYLVCGEDYQCQTVIELDTGRRVDHVDPAAMEAMARGDDARRMGALKAMWGDRLSEGWIRFKVERWRAAADPEAVAAYVRMFARDGLPSPTAKVAIPLLAVTGEHDGEIMRRDAVLRLLSPLCERLTVTAIADAGHYPMQETPPLLVTILQRFLAGEPASGGA